MTGEGVKAGYSHGETDDFSYNINSGGVYIHDPRANIMQSLGIDHERLTYKYQNRHFRLTGVHRHVVKPLLVSMVLFNSARISRKAAMHWLAPIRPMTRASVIALHAAFFAAAIISCNGSFGADIAATQLFVGNYCIDCHSGDEAEAGLDLDAIEKQIPTGDANWDPSPWEKVVKRLRGRQMPPADSSRPSEEEYQQTLAELESALDREAGLHPRPGRTSAVRRLTRAEYKNAIRDLLDLEVDVDELLPADHFAHGFDNVNVEDLSPALMERYLKAAEFISRLALGDQSQPSGRTIRIPADRTQDSHVAGLPLGTRGGALIKHNFPQAGDYEVRLRLTRDRDEHIEGLYREHKLDVLLDDAIAHRFTIKPAENDGYVKQDHTNLDAHLRTRFVVTAGPHDVGVTFPATGGALAETKRQPFDASFNRHRHPRQNPAVFEITITGPFDSAGIGRTPSRERIFVARPEAMKDDAAYGELIVRNLLRRAYRRPVSEADMSAPMRFFQEAIEMNGFEYGAQRALAAILVNPNFLLRIEQHFSGAPATDSYQIDDTELASRLSFFLWSSIPDDELLDLAETSRLSEPSVLRDQVNRMLLDPRSESLVTNFASQWLYLRNLDSFRPDMRLFPDFDDNLRRAMRSETELLFKSVLREDRSVLDLIQTDTTYLNERLAKHYDIPHVAGSHFRPVKVSADSHRGGLLRHASILAVTSYATRTSPTIRGNWVLENIFGSPAPPPPPNVPSLKNKSTLATLTLRQRLAEHRANPACASCHNLMDPVGLAMENFDAVGNWRFVEEGKPVDASGSLPDGTAIDGVEALEAGVLKRPELFAGTLVEKLMTFALGRGMKPTDGPAVRNILRQASANNYRFSDLVIGIVESPQFQMRAPNTGTPIAATNRAATKGIE